MSLFVAFLVIAAVVVAAITVVDVLRSHLGRAPKSAWVLIVVLLPFAGSIAYWLMRPEPPEDTDRRLGARAELRRSGSDRPPGRPGVY